ncbi:hypothetical protein RS130_23210 [Paraglaciecola aquimarina]|uniref:Outer membrane protein beta-barrel domain-containing protein n=1 Tax=Paraglaciecola aquimarina TaxID=1235557 RepID=A0ABU3T2C5_9ALTE|nr:hypothetical protein [Paraglaciecola aquimarina]MDU0356416.1 hypothetical protein [Paraglaciecola aquimarina]
MKRQFVAVLSTVLTLVTVSLPTHAVELGINGHQGTERETQGYEIYVTDNFSRRSPFYWRLGLSRYNDVFVEWNGSELEFPMNHAEAALSYRHPLFARSPTMRRLSFEFQAGAAVSLTENKFTWAELDEEKYFSESGDISAFVALSAHYKVSSNISASLGIKHFPDMSEFGSISSAFLGVKFNFNFGPTYYGN